MYAVFFLCAANRLKAAGADRRADATAWLDAFRAGCDGIIELGGAGRGDRTMLDALLPAFDALTDALNAAVPVAPALASAATAAALGCEGHRRSATATRPFELPRCAGHRPRRSGAEAVAVWLRAVADSLSSG